MAKLEKNIVDFCGAVAPYSYVFAVVTALVVGIMLAVPSEKLHEKAKSYGGWAILGTSFIAGCVYLGKNLTSYWSF